MERRKEPRWGAVGRVRMRIGDRSVLCRMRDISQTGCMVESPAFALSLGTRVEFDLGLGVLIEGEIAWQLGEHFGVYFDTNLPDQMLEKFSAKEAKMSPSPLPRIPRIDTNT